MGGKCFDCGLVSAPCVYDFHHENGSDKDASVSRLQTWEKIEKELQKCVMLCANCHRLRHHAKGPDHKDRAHD